MSQVFAGEELLTLLRCKKNVDASPGVYKVTLRLYPLLSPIEKSIGSSRTTLAAAIAEYDIYATAFQHLLRNSTRNGNLELAHVPSILAHPDTPDTIILVRGNQVIVFPRAFLASPRIATSAAANGDVIATLFFKEFSSNDQDRNIDPFRVFADDESKRRKLDDDSTISVFLSGPLLTSNQYGRRSFSASTSGGRLSDLTLGAFLEGTKVGKGIEPAIEKQSSVALSNTVSICVVTRQMQAVTVRYVSPLSTTGVFGKSGTAMRSLFRDAKSGSELSIDALNQKWDELFGNKIRDIHLQDGDVLEFTTTDFVPPFIEIALQ